MNLDFSSIGLDNNKISLTMGLYSEPHRYYHGQSHLDKMLRLAITSKLARIGNEEMFLKLLVAIIYHDAIYKVGSKTNEEESAELYRIHHGRDSIIEQAIMVTKTHLIPDDFNVQTAHINTVELLNTIIELDLYDILYPDRLTIHNNINQLYKEQQYPLLDSQTSFATFIENNIKWVRTYDKQLPKESIDQYIGIVNNMMLSI